MVENKGQENYFFIFTMILSTSTIGVFRGGSRGSVQGMRDDLRFSNTTAGLSLSFEAAVAKEDSPVTSHKYL